MKNKSLILLIVSVFLLVLTSCNNNNTGDVTVFGGESQYTIVTAADAPDEAKELAKSLCDLSEGKLVSKTDSAPETDLEILIGDTNRAATATVAGELKARATTSAFYYVVAESDGKIVILSDDDVGYIYALDYIKQTYITDGKLSIPRATSEFKAVIWDDYYNSDLYFDRLTAEADKNRYEEEKGQLKDEMNKYEDEKGNPILTIEQAIQQYKDQAAAFKSEDFGVYSSAQFVTSNTYGMPGITPGDKTDHPRILFTNETKETVYNNLSAKENAKAYRQYIALSDAPCDGKFKDLTGNMSENYDDGVSAQIEAKAFRYAMERDAEKYPNPDDDPAALYGYEAIVAAKNAMLTINVPHTVGDWCRTYGHLMYVVACVYDWCYDLMTETDKQQFIDGGVVLLGKHFEIVCYSGPGGDQTPTKQGTAYGHGAEDQLLVDYLAFAIATYNEAPDIYNLVAGRILNEYTKAQNYLFKSGSHWEGSMYGSVRTAATIVSNILFNKMKNGTELPFENVDEAILTSTYYIRPDGLPFRIGDQNENKTYASFQFNWYAVDCFYAGNLYDSAYLKSISYKYLNGFNTFYNGVAGMSVIQFLAINNPETSYIYEGTAPLTRTTSYPNTNIFLRSANNDKNAFAVYMTMPETYATSHGHMECGSFQIFYKGILASDSGAYTSWGGAHHMGYNMSTISSNSLLIYNPKYKDHFNSERKNWVYSGGQSIDNSAVLPDTYEAILASPARGQCVSLGTANVEVNGKYLYSYMGGDMTGAYDDDTVDEVTRYMFAVATGREDYPLVFITFDRITATDASFHKAALIHTQMEPTITEDGFAIITNTERGNSGKMIVQSVGFDTEYVAWGGEGQEYWIPGVDENGNYSLEDGYNLPVDHKSVDGSVEEYGWGRIEISPAVHEKTNHMLTVMYVTDATNNASPIKAAEIVSDNLVGSELFGKSVMFPKDESLLESESTFTVSGGECFVAGVEAGNWQVLDANGTVVATATAQEGTNLINFTLSAGTYTLKLAN